MANDISYFKVEGDQTQYSFNDADLEARIGATALPTTAQTITGAVAEHEGDITTLNSQVATLDSKFTSYLPADTNIDNWTTSGFWLYERGNASNHTGTFPISDTYGTLICVRGTSANFAIQMIRSNSTSRTEGTLYIRYRSAATWGDWMIYGGVEFTREIKYATTASVSANSVKDFDITVSKSGYTFLGIVGTFISAGGGCVTCYTNILSESTVRFRLLNTASSATTPEAIGVWCLYRKN